MQLIIRSIIRLKIQRGWKAKTRKQRSGQRRESSASRCIALQLIFLFFKPCAQNPGKRREDRSERKRQRKRERGRKRGASLKQRGTSWRFIFPGLVVENARLATTFSNDNNYPRETSLPIRRERLLFFIYRQAHYFCASKHIKNSPLARARSSPPPLPLFSPLHRHLLAAATDPCNDQESRVLLN